VKNQNQKIFTRNLRARVEKQKKFLRALCERVSKQTRDKDRRVPFWGRWFFLRFVRPPARDFPGERLQGFAPPPAFVYNFSRGRERAGVSPELRSVSYERFGLGGTAE
jgi:hypothetical protein